MAIGTKYTINPFTGQLDAYKVKIGPGFSFGRENDVITDTWLNVEGVPSNKVGRFVYVDRAKVIRVFVSTETETTFDLTAYYHDGNGANMTTLGTVSIVSAFGDSFDVSWSVPIDKQLALKVTSGSARNIVAGLELQGNC